MPPTIDAGTRFAFAPYPVPIEHFLYRIHVVFETSRGDLLCAHTNLMAPTLETADTMCDALNSQLNLDRDQWKYLASAVFAFVESQAEQAQTNQRPTPEDSQP